MLRGNFMGLFGTYKVFFYEVASSTWLNGLTFYEAIKAVCNVLFVWKTIIKKHHSQQHLHCSFAVWVCLPKTVFMIQSLSYMIQVFSGLVKVIKLLTSHPKTRL